MRLLVVTQALDLDDALLSSYHSWVAELGARFTSVEAICLKEGRHTLPQNVRVHSLGKEEGRVHPLRYAFRFLILAWRLRGSYDRVFVHMNQEYVLIAGWLWKLLGKPMYLWRNHYAGSMLTDAAAMFCAKVFCTSIHSYTAKYAKTVIMPVGVDTTRFNQRTSVVRKPRSILFFSRITESKRPGLVVDALIALAKRGAEFTAAFVGSPPTANDEPYLAALRQRIADARLMDRIVFLPGVSNSEAPSVFEAYQVYVNASPSGMFDKMIFEAAASGCVVLAASDDYRLLAGDGHWFKDAAMLTDRLEASDKWCLGRQLTRAGELLWKSNTELT